MKVGTRGASRISLLLALGIQSLWAQAKPEPDVIVFADGERLAGQFERSNGTSITFKSDMIGEITVDWTKVREFQSSKVLAVIPKGVVLRRQGSTAAIPQGTVAVAEKNLVVTPQAGAPQPVPVANLDHVLPETVFENAITHNPGIFSDWAGTVTGGASLVQATQESRSFNAAVNLVRVDPTEDWLVRQNRTTFTFNESYGTVKQPESQEVKTDILHAGLERDEYFSPSFFGFAEGLLDHNFSQGLTLQQTYGGGLGWSVHKSASESLDLKASANYINQDFGHSAARQSLIAAMFEEDFRRTLVHGIVFTQQLIGTPAFNNTRAYSATGNAMLTLPVYKRLGSSIGVIDSFLNDPPPGFRKNSFQFTAGATYSLR